jgi:hypothetical protein
MAYPLTPVFFSGTIERIYIIMYRLYMPKVAVISEIREDKRRYITCPPGHEKPSTRLPGYLLFRGFVMGGENQVECAGFRHLITPVYVTMRQDHIIF